MIGETLLLKIKKLNKIEWRCNSKFKEFRFHVYSWTLGGELSDGCKWVFFFLAFKVICILPDHCYTD